jgi:hypothetical protein
MKNSDRLRYYWMDRQLISMYGPFRCYSAWEAWAWVAAIVILFVCLWGGTP